MTFKVGDNVRVIGVTDGYDQFNGKTGVVNEVNGDDPYAWNTSVTIDGYSLAFAQNELELVVETTLEEQLAEAKSLVEHLEEQVKIAAQSSNPFSEFKPGHVHQTSDNDLFVKVAKNSWVLIGTPLDGQRSDEVVVYRDDYLESQA